MGSSSWSSSETVGSRSDRCRTCRQNLLKACYCLYPVTKQVSGTTANPGRRFLSCPARRCRFFIWVDEPPPRDPNGLMIDELNEKLKVAEKRVNMMSMELEDYKRGAASSRRSSVLAWTVIWVYIVVWSVSMLLHA